MAALGGASLIGAVSSGCVQYAMGLPVADSFTDLYRTRAERFGRDEARHTQRWNAVANLRLVFFLLALGGTVWGILDRDALIAGVSGALWVIFLGLVRYHARLARQRARSGAFRAVNEEALRRIARDWQTLPLREAPLPSPEHPYAYDLDLYGTGSLVHLLDTTGTRPGYATLRAWLETPAAPDQVQLRQGAVRELAPLLELRQKLQVEGR
ncbi:MAG TPA: hypothetical protein VGW38_26745, partial [Chloroflexota bacterium]|nr:hypothetical protein [Chloroflexota bacterium]